MSNGRRTEPPNWWSLDSYDYLSDLDLRGWIWEFMRRSILLQSDEVPIVDVMNPNPDLSVIRGLYQDLYNLCTDELWANRFPIFFQRAVNIMGDWPRGSNGQPFRIMNEREFVKITVDLNRRDKVIVNDFKSLLEELRYEHPEPEQKKPRPEDWVNAFILQIWDLRQLRVIWPSIGNIFYNSRNQSILGHHVSNREWSVRNAHYTDRRLIDHGDFNNLIDYI